jgi:SAM-dependent methyltransferase
MLEAAVKCFLFVFFLLLLALVSLIKPSEMPPVRSTEARYSGPDWDQPIPDVLFIPTPHDVVVEMLELANAQEDDLVYDLGCGDGRILVCAVQRFGGRAVGFDIDRRRVKQARENLIKNRVEARARVEEKDLFQVDVHAASIITLYLSPKFNARLIPQLETLRPGSRIVSHQFDMRGIAPEKEVHYQSQEDGRIHTLFLWTTPLKRRVVE